ncbi:MAG: hypothetical protein ACRC18_06770 [Cetobacterium sp.]
MSRYSKMGKVAKRGAVDSKYFGNMEQFDKDVQDKIDNSNRFKSKVRELILEDPNLIEQRYYELIETMLEIKKEYDIKT